MNASSSYAKLFSPDLSRTFNAYPLANQTVGAMPLFEGENEHE
jgi:hypothetical protein